jgi:hypothetical protein
MDGGMRVLWSSMFMVFSSYGLVYALMKLRTKTSKTAE